jgi:transposase-like protein
VSQTKEKTKKREKAKKRVYTTEFKAAAVARMKHCKSVVGLARELGICWSLLYQWRDRLENRLPATPEGQEARDERATEKELTELKLALAKKTLELDFFRGALQKVEALRQKPGGVAFTTKSGK